VAPIGRPPCCWPLAAAAIAYRFGLLNVAIAAIVLAMGLEVPGSISTRSGLPQA
jgi:hypothetical protein